MLDPVMLSRNLEASTLARRPTGGAPEQLPDLLLIERSRSADEQAIEALVRRYGRRLFRIARSVLGDDERAESVVREVYLAAFGDLSRYEPTGKFAAWLSHLTYQQARVQRAGSRLAQGANGFPGNGAAPPAGEEAQERHELELAVASLPEVFRTVFVLRVIEGISGIETAASLGVHETTVRTRLYRAHRRLNAELVRRITLQQPGLLDLTGARLERLVNRVLGQLPNASMLTACATASP